MRVTIKAHTGCIEVEPRRGYGIRIAVSIDDNGTDGSSVFIDPAVANTLAQAIKDAAKKAAS